MKIPLLPFTVPNYVIARVRAEGQGEAPKWPLSEIDAETLAQLCDDFRSDVFNKAGKKDPATLK